jgi:hypothetical protein
MDSSSLVEQLLCFGVGQNRPSFASTRAVELHQEIRLVAHQGLSNVQWLQVEAVLSFTSFCLALGRHARTSPSAPPPPLRLTHALFIPIWIWYAKLSRPPWRSIHWCRWTNLSTVAAEVVGSLVSTPYFRCTYNRFTWCLLGGVETRWTIDIGHHNRWIRPSTPVDGSSWDWRELWVFGGRGRVSNANHIRRKMMEPSLQRHGTPKAWGSPCKKREGFSNSHGRGSHRALLNGMDGFA